MSLTSILVILSFVVAFVILSIIILPKGARTREDVENDRAREKAMDSVDKKEREEYKVTSIWKWLLIYLSSIVPILNIIILFVLAFKKYETNLTVKNWARTMLIFILLGLVLTIAACLICYFMFFEQTQSFLQQYLSI